MLPELLSNACSETETTERWQETTNGWKEAVTSEQGQKRESSPIDIMLIGVTHWGASLLSNYRGAISTVSLPAQTHQVT